MQVGKARYRVGQTIMLSSGLRGIVPVFTHITAKKH